jgi:uncharacterized protein with PQ loop repeat
MNTDLPVLAGSLSTVIFVLSALPMLVKAARTKDLSSYSLGNIMLANLGNVLYCIYVLHLPMGPAWALHGFHLISTGLMLVWYLRYAVPRIPRAVRRPHRSQPVSATASSTPPRRGRVRPAPQRRPVRFATETPSASGNARGVPRRPAARTPSLARGGVS